jgi:hypothetical protein
VVLFATGCTTFHCGFAFAGETFKKSAVNCTCCAGVISVGTVAVEGVTAVRMPVSRVSDAAPVFALFAAAVDVNVMIGIGFGKLASVGAVYVRTLLVEDGVAVHVPRLPPPSAATVWPEVQFCFAVCAGFGCAVVGNGVYTNVQLHVEARFVVPVTVDVKVATVSAITVSAGGETVTTTVFGPEPLHPFSNINAPASISIAAVSIVRHFMNDISLMKSARATFRAHFLEPLFPLRMA